MAKYPHPPETGTLQAVAPEIRTLDSGTRVYRIFQSSSQHEPYWNTFRFFGPTSSRFDHQLPDEYGQPQVAERGILYGAVGAEAIPTCIAEFFQNTGTIDRHTGSPVLCAFTLEHPLHLLDLSGAFLTNMGMSIPLNAGTRPWARCWTQKLYEAYAQIHGIYYCSSSYGNHPAIALFERARLSMPDYPDFHRLLSDPALDDTIITMANTVGYLLDDLHALGNRFSQTST